MRLVRFLPTLAGGQWPHDTMIGLLKSGLLGVSSDEIDEVENYVLAHRIRGAAWAAETLVLSPKTHGVRGSAIRR